MSSNQTALLCRYGVNLLLKKICAPYKEINEEAAKKRPYRKPLLLFRPPVPRYELWPPDRRGAISFFFATDHYEKNVNQIERYIEHTWTYLSGIWES